MGSKLYKFCFVKYKTTRSRLYRNEVEILIKKPTAWDHSINARSDFLEKILFDISHIARRPVASMLGLVGYIDIEKLDERMIREYARHLRLVATEMDTYLTELNRKYSAIRSTVTEPVSQEK